MELNEQIKLLAFEIYEKNGYIENHDLDNWLEAEKIILKQNESVETQQEMETEVEIELQPVG